MALIINNHNFRKPLTSEVVARKSGDVRIQFDVLKPKPLTFTHSPSGDLTYGSLHLYYCVGDSSNAEILNILDTYYGTFYTDYPYYRYALPQALGMQCSLMDTKSWPETGDPGIACYFAHAVFKALNLMNLGAPSLVRNRLVLAAASARCALSLPAIGPRKKGLP